MLGATGSPCQFDNLILKIFIYSKHEQKAWNANECTWKVVKGLFSRQGGNQKCPHLEVQTYNAIFFRKDWALMSHDLYKIFVCHKSTTSCTCTCWVFSMINTPHWAWNFESQIINQSNNALSVRNMKNFQYFLLFKNKLIVRLWSYSIKLQFSA